ncbi:MAG TPA: hypothetical protein VF720_12510 [Candidatus Eisenbacteria bacterium]
MPADSLRRVTPFALIFVAALPMTLAAAIPATPAALHSKPPPDHPAGSPSSPPALIDAQHWPIEAGDTWRYLVRRVERRPGDDLVLEDSAEVRVLASFRHGRRRVAALEWRRPDFDLLPPWVKSDLPLIVPRRIDVEYQVLDDSRLVMVDDPERLGVVMASTGNGAPEEETRVPLDDLPLPLVEGGRWGAPAMLARPDGLYTGTTGALTTLSLPIGQVRAVPVTYRTLPDREDRWLSPDLGLVRRQYRHQGLDLLETWELAAFTHEAVDSLALANRIDARVRELIKGEGSWSRRSALASDPVLAALLGPMVATETPEDDDGVRRIFLRGASGQLTLERLPDGPTRAWRVARASGGVVRRRFTISDDVPRPLPPGTSRLDLAEVNSLFETARRSALQGDARGAAGRVEAAMQILTGRLIAAAPESGTSRAPAEAWRETLGAAAGDSVLVTRYGSRVRIDDDDLRVDLEIDRDLWALTARRAGPDGGWIGGAPRLVLGTAPPVVLVEPEDSITDLAPRRWLTLDWGLDHPGLDVLVLAESPTGLARRLDLFRVDKGRAERGWTRLLAGGRARMAGDSRRLDVESERPDPRLSAAVQHWRESYGPPDSPESISPVPLRWERLDPWLDVAVSAVEWLRRSDTATAPPSIRGEGLAVRLASTWLARRDVRVARVLSYRAAPNDELSSPVASVAFHRERAAGRAEAEPEVLSLRLVREHGEWVVVDLVAGDVDSGEWER